MPLSGFSNCPPATSQSLIVYSKLPLASSLPSGWKATIDRQLVTCERFQFRAGRECPTADVVIRAPARQSFPSGEMASVLTRSVCAESWRKLELRGRVPQLDGLVSPVLASVLPSGVKATEVTSRRASSAHRAQASLRPARSRLAEGTRRDCRDARA